MRRAIPGILASAYAVLIYVFIFLPVVVLVLYSFQSTLLPVPPFTGPSLRWYYAVFADRRLMTGLWNSFLVATASSVISVLLGFLAAYGFARFNVTGKRALNALLTAPLSVSYLIIGMGLLIGFTYAGVPKSLLAVGIGHVVINMPLCFAIILSQMADNQVNVERAARDLGAAEWQVLIHVTAPMLAPALFASFFLAMTFSWDEFIIAFLLSRFDNTLPVEIWSLLRSGLSPKTNAIGSLVFLVSILLVIFLEVTVLGKRKS